MSKKKLNKELNHLFKSLKIKKGDKIIIHSNIAGLLQFYFAKREIISEIFISYLKKYLGKKGIIAIPTYNYQFTKNKNFNLKKSLSQVGFFGNYLIKKKWKNRTLDPIFSHIVSRKLENFDFETINSDAFGEKSFFNFAERENFKIICFCCSIKTITYLHYIEHLLQVPYRYIKKFRGYFIKDNKKYKIIYKYNVGKKKIDYTPKEEKISQLINQKNFIKTYFGRFECFSVDCKYLYSAIAKKTKNNKNFLISL